jgi:predicted nuclease with RNAse H fold
MFYFLGIDIAGSKNTWAVSLKYEKSFLKLCPSLSLKSPLEPSYTEDFLPIIEFCMKEKVLSVAIDAPLSFSLEDKKGIRLSDKALKKILPSKARSWVVSYHALAAIPIRALLLSEALSPFCGTIIETHPRASLYFCLPQDKKEISFRYKKNLSAADKKFLIAWLKKKFQLSIDFDFNLTEGILDAIMCALAGYFYHRAPEKLIFLPSEKNFKGFGPFVIISF